MAKVTGSQKINSKISVIESRLLNAAHRQIGIEINKLESETKREIQGGSRSGRTYKRRTVTHQASAPGEFPKTDTGALVRSFGTSVVKTFGKVVGSFFNVSSYAMALEFGTSKMAKRPFMRPVYFRNKHGMEEAVKRAMKAELKRITSG